MEDMVSVVIPAYNMAEFLEAAIESVLEGEYENVEVICVDDGSTDATKQVVRQFTTPGSVRYDERVRYFSQSNQGKSVAVNRGLSEMSGAYFTLLDADDRLPPQSISKRIEALGNNRTAEVAIGGFDVIDDMGRRVSTGRASPDTDDAGYLRREFYLSYKTPFHLNTCLIRRRLLERVGLFDSYLDRCQDGDYAIRCMRETEGISIVNETVYLYRKHRESVWKRIAMRMETAQYRPYVMWKNFSTPQKYIYAGYVFLLDLAKMGYEIFANYKK